jgi:hypothetical protein
MAPFSILEHTFSLLSATRSISRKTITNLLNLRFNGEGGISTFHHVSQFNIIFNTLDICDENEICKLFTVTLHRRIRGWFQVLPIKSIQSWKQLMKIFS